MWTDQPILNLIDQARFGLQQAEAYHYTKDQLTQAHMNVVATVEQANLDLKAHNPYFAQAHQLIKEWLEVFGYEGALTQETLTFAINQLTLIIHDLELAYQLPRP